jgi:hypothetical protein
MKKMLVTLLITLFCFQLSAPPFERLTILRDEAIKVYDSMLNAFMFVESSYRTNIINSLGYGGILQIGQEMIDETNRICKLNGMIESFKLTDRMDSTKAVRMWYIVQTYWNPSYDLKRACKIWNPLASNNYRRKIQKQLNKTAL